MEVARRANLWQFANAVTVKKISLNVDKHSMNPAFGSKSRLEMKVKLWRLPPVGYANDIETGAFEVDENIVPATNRLFEQYPDAQPWVIRIGHRAVDHFGARSLKKRRVGTAHRPYAIEEIRT
jgi:hypothetical protein